MSWFSSWGAGAWGNEAPEGDTQSLGSLPGTGAQAPAGASGTPVVGELVEYFSATQNAWIPAKVLSITKHSTYNLDCKPEVPPDKIRQLHGSHPGAEFKQGDVVEYYSASAGKWIRAKVLGVNPKGTYALDCKPDVFPDKVRRPQRGASTSPTRGQAPVGLPPSASFAPPARGAPPRSGLAQGEMAAPVQLLRVERSGSRWRYEVCPEGAALLESYGSRRIAVAAICGLYRTGKSFLLNMLLERVQRGLPPFQMGGTTKACTEGIWLWGSAESDDDQSPLLAFLDCEGFGSTESDQTRDAQLMTLCALLSSVLVLNTKGALNEGLFNALALSCKFAEHVEDPGSEASRPSLMWVLRDFMLELRDAGGRPMTPDEYLEQALHAAPLTGSTQERGRSAREVRRSLLKFFGHRSCTTLVQPVVEEAELQSLEQLPYSSLRPEFRAGVEALRTQLTATCHSSPKMVGGQPLGCFAFVALMRQLVAAMNGNRMVSIRSSWESVQRMACEGLLDELRSIGSQSLKAVASGQPLPGGARLPMTDEALQGVLRERRHLLKAQWDERAFGDEAVRKEYWQELKETLAKEEQMVRLQNARLADQQLMETLNQWQEWLDDDGGAMGEGERVASDLGRLMERMPAAPLSRAGRTAIEAAARRVASARTAVVATVEQSSEAQRRVMAWGEQASQLKTATLTELEKKHSELHEVQEELKKVQHEVHSKEMDLDVRSAELEDAKTQFQAAMKSIEDAHLREHEFKAQHRLHAEKEASLRAELEATRATSAKAEAERLASEQIEQAAAAARADEQQRLEAALQAARSEAERYAEQLASERSVLKAEHDKTRTEHLQKVEDHRKQLEVERETLRGEHEKTRTEHQRMVESAQRMLEEERRRHQETLEGEQGRLLERERQAGVLEGQVAALSSEAVSLRDRMAELQATLREAESRASQQKQESDRLRDVLDRSRFEAEKVRIESDEKVRTHREECERTLQEDARRKKSAFGCMGSRARKGFKAPAKA